MQTHFVNLFMYINQNIQIKFPEKKRNEPNTAPFISSFSILDRSTDILTYFELYHVPIKSMCDKLSPNYKV